VALTQAKVDRVTCEGTSWTWIADNGKRGLGSGFGLRVYKSEVKSYALRYRAARRLRFYTIGKASILTLDEARERDWTVVDMAREWRVVYPWESDNKG